MDFGWRCPLCNLSSQQKDKESYERHLAAIHSEQLEEHNKSNPSWATELTRQAFTQLSSVANPPHPPHPPLSPRSTNTASVSVGVGLGKLNLDGQSSTPLIRLRQPGRPASLNSPEYTRPETLTRPSSASNAYSTKDFSQFTAQNRPIFRYDVNDVNDNDRRRKAPSSTASSPVASVALPRRPTEITDPRYPGLLMQPDSRGISHEQLVQEVRAIYSGLTMIEAKAISVDKNKMEAAQKGPLPIKTLVSLMNIHKALLNEHHDFFLASQHPSAIAGLHKLAEKYLMPARMWKHGIHSLLELLRHQLPHSSEFIVQFIYHSYQIMSLLLETVPHFEDTWIECLGDLSRYRMAVEEEDMRERDTWASTARYWYCKAADKTPKVGRLYHHLAILARANPPQQLYLYSRSLTSVQPFQPARESIQSLLQPAMEPDRLHIPETGLFFIRSHAALFNNDLQLLKESKTSFISQLESQISRLTGKWREYGVYFASTNIGALFSFGQRNYLTQLFEHGNFLQKNEHITSYSPDLQAQWDKCLEPVEMDMEVQDAFDAALDLFFETFDIVLSRPYDRNCQPFLHTTLAFLQTLLYFRKYEKRLPLECQKLLDQFLKRTPWTKIANFCNAAIKLGEFGDRFESNNYMKPSGSREPGCLPEDWLLWGLIWSESYYPEDWFSSSKSDEDRSNELPSTVNIRCERILHMCWRLAHDNDDVIVYSSKRRQWMPQGPPGDPDSILIENTDAMNIDQEKDSFYLLSGDVIKSEKTLIGTLSTETETGSYAISETMVEELIHESRNGEGSEQSYAITALKHIATYVKSNKLSVLDTQGETKNDFDTLLERNTQREYDYIKAEIDQKQAVLNVASATKTRKSGIETLVVILTKEKDMQDLAEKRAISWDLPPNI